MDRLNHDSDLPEMTLRGMLLGAVLTVIFTASNVYLGLKVGLTSLFSNGFQVLTGQFSMWIPFGNGITQLSLGYSTALVGAGYLIGIASGLALLTGIILAWLVMIPYFTMTGTPAEGQTLQEFAQACYVGKVRLIGAGAMGVAAIWTLIKLARPVMI